VALLGLPSAVLVQRLGVRATMLISDACRAPLLVAVPALHTLGLLSFPLLLGLVFALGVFSAPYLSAQRLVIPETFRDDESFVVQGNAFLEGVIRFATLLGPAIAGAAIGAFGAHNVLYLDGLSYLVAFVILLRTLPARTRTVSTTAPGEGRGVFAGARFVARNPVLRRVTATALLFGAFFPPLLASLPVLTTERYGGNPRIAGLLYAAWGAGALLGTFLVLRLARRVPPLRLGAIGCLGMALPMWLLVLPLTPLQFGLVLLLSGLFAPIINAPIISLIMLSSPLEVRAQVLTFVMTANLLAGPLAYMLTGPALDWLGLTPVYLLVALGNTATAALMMTFARSGRAQRPATVD
jgi:predicted MFS family arabinose efflux permease